MRSLLRIVSICNQSCCCDGETPGLTTVIMLSVVDIPLSADTTFTTEGPSQPEIVMVLLTESQKYKSIFL